MKKINLAITGCMGRMGQQLIKSSKNAKNFRLVSVTENRIVNKKISGLKPQLNLASSFKNFNFNLLYILIILTLNLIIFLDNL